jgi:hypothetical protein
MGHFDARRFGDEHAHSGSPGIDLDDEEFSGLCVTLHVDGREAPMVEALE